jgi:class 3 adenylate cyclase
MRKFKYVIGAISFILVTTGLILKLYRMPLNLEITGVGLLLFVVGFSYSLFRLVIQQSRKALQISTIILFIGIEASILGMLFKVYHLPFAGHLGIIAIALFYVWWVFYSSEGEGRKLRLRKDRQLAAILFTDIVGFTAMMGEDEEKTLDILNQNRSIQKRIIRKHRGKWLKEMGDGSMVIFYTATEALAAALEIQGDIQRGNKFNVRMGIHTSEIVFTDTDVFGDGVNLASRITDKASANEICISDAVFQNVRNREDLKVANLGQMEFKNVAYPINVYKIETH